VASKSSGATSCFPSHAFLWTSDIGGLSSEYAHSCAAVNLRVRKLSCWSGLSTPMESAKTTRATCWRFCKPSRCCCEWFHGSTRLILRGMRFAQPLPSQLQTSQRVLAMSTCTMNCGRHYIWICGLATNTLLACLTGIKRWLCCSKPKAEWTPTCSWRTLESRPKRWRSTSTLYQKGRWYRRAESFNSERKISSLHSQKGIHTRSFRVLFSFGTPH